MTFRKKSISVILAILGVFLVCAGCGSQNDYVITGNNANPTSAIRLTSVLARTVPSPITDFRFTGLNANGEPVYGPTKRTKSSDILLENVPVTVTKLQIEYLAGGILAARGVTDVSLQAGQTFTLTDPDFDVVFADQPLQISPSDSTILVDTTRALSASAKLVEGGTTDVTSLVDWSTDSPSVATIDTSGLVSAKSVGTTNVTATLTLGNFSISGTTQLTVAPVLTSLEVFPKNSFGSPAGGIQYRVLGTFSDGSNQLLTDQVHWSITNQGSSGASADVTISDSGLASIPEASAKGQKATVTAEMAGISDTATLTLNSFLYTTTATLDDAFVYSRDTVDGTLTPLSTPTVTTGHLVTDPIYSPDGRLLFLTNGSATFSMFTIGDDGLTVPNVDPATTTNRITEDNGLSGVPTIFSGGAVDPRNRFLYVIDINIGEILTFQIDDNGLVTFLRRTPRSGDGYPDAKRMKISADARFMFILTGNGKLESYAIQKDGTFEKLSSVTTSSDSGEFAITPSGNRIYVNNDYDDLVYGFNISSSGMLSPIVNPATGNNETATPHDQARQIAATDEYLYVRIRGTGLIAMYKIEANGVLSPNIDPGSGANTISAPLTNFAVGPTGRFVYSVYTALQRYEIGPNGLLSNPANTSISSAYQVLISP